MVKGITPLRGKATREERPATELELGTYALTWPQHELSILSGKVTEGKRAATEFKRSPSPSSVTAPFSLVTLSLSCVVL